LSNDGLIVKALVMGATGFIGGAIARAAVAQGWQVRAMRRDDRRQGAIDDLAEKAEIEWYQANLIDASTIAQAMLGCDVVFHSAGYYPSTSRDRARQVRRAQTQMEGVLLAFRQAKPDLLVYTSSLSTIAPPSEPDRLANENDVYQLGSVTAPYFDIKIVMEQTALESGLPVVALCPTAVFGPGDVKPTSGRLIISTARGLMPFYPEGQINVVDVRDVAAAHVAAVECGRIGQRYIIGHENMSFYQMLATMAHQSGRRPPWIRLPSRIVELAGSVAGQLDILGGDMLQAIRSFQPLDTGKARAELGLTTRPFTESVCDALAWFNERGYLGSRVDGRQAVNTN
jgi:dihydroflavonol-4-reductase